MCGVLKNICVDLYSNCQQQGMNSFLPNPPQNLPIFILIIAILSGAGSYLTVILFSISLIAKIIRQFFHIDYFYFFGIYLDHSYILDSLFC